MNMTNVDATPDISKPFPLREGRQTTVAYPHPFHYDPRRTALIVVDMQNDFLHSEGFCCSMPWVTPSTIERMRGIIPRVLTAIDWARGCGLRVVFTRESHPPDLSDLTLSKKIRYENAGFPVGARGKLGRFLIRGQRSAALIDELQPDPEDLVYDKPGQSAFHATTLAQALRESGVDALLFAGVTTPTCVLASYRQAADLGFFTLLLEDCCMAFNVCEHASAIDVLQSENGAAGWVTSSREIMNSFPEGVCARESSLLDSSGRSARRDSESPVVRRTISTAAHDLSHGSEAPLHRSDSFLPNYRLE